MEMEMGMEMEMAMDSGICTNHNQDISKPMPSFSPSLQYHQFITITIAIGISISSIVQRVELLIEASKIPVLLMLLTCEVRYRPLYH